MPKIISYNVNGLRAALRKGLGPWLLSANPDVFCIQEIKATPDQIDATFLNECGYNNYWNPAEKKGYSGVAIFTKEAPQHVETGCGISKYDCEGRVLRVDFKDYSVLNVYMPSGTSGEVRQQFKYEWLDDFYHYLIDLSKKHPHLIITGDFNICHRPIDIHNPVANARTTGFLPAERDWMEKLFNSGFIDTFRHFNKEPHNYTWWSTRLNARERNLGWRIDYQVATAQMENRLKRAVILPDAKHSDHCPTLLEII